MTEERSVPAAVPLGSTNRGTKAPVDAPSVPTRATTTPRSPRPSTRRLGRRGLAVVRQSLSARDLAVLASVAEHRYLTTRQIEGFHFGGHATPLTGARVARRVLRRLLELRVLAHLERRIGGVQLGSASYVWRVGPIGDRVLRERDERPRRRQREPGSPFLDHCLAVADAHLSLVIAARRGELELVDVQLEPDCWRPFTGLGGGRLVLQPDLYVVTGDPSDPVYVNTWFVEIDRGTESLPRLLAKCAQYERFSDTGIEQEQSGGSFPLVVWVMSGQAATERLSSALRADRGLTADRFRVTTADGLVGLITGGAL